MLVDAHLNTSGAESAADILKSFDDAKVDLGVLLAPFLGNGYTLHDEAKLREGNTWLAKTVSADRERLVGLAVVNPLHKGAPDEVRRALGDLKLTGLKMVPTGWYPYDDCAHRVYEAAAEFDAPVLFHSGIFIDGRSGRFCRPAFFEALREHPRLRVVLAHLSWPWTDEAIAVGLIDRINGVPADRSQIRFDFSYGAPPPWRHEMMKKALAMLGPELLQFGSDRVLPCSGAHIRSMIDEVRQLLDELEVDKAAQARIFAGTALNWLKPGAGR